MAGAARIGNDHRIEQAFIERMGATLESQGLPRHAGRIFALLMLTDDPPTLEEIAEELRISSGSASSNTRLLESLDMVERFTARGERRVRHRVHDDPLPRLLSGTIARLGRLTSIMHETRSQLDANRRTTVKRLKGMEEAFDRFMDSLRAVLENETVRK